MSIVERVERRVSRNAMMLLAGFVTEEQAADDDALLALVRACEAVIEQHGDGTPYVYVEGDLYTAMRTALARVTT